METDPAVSLFSVRFEVFRHSSLLSFSVCLFPCFFLSLFVFLYVGPLLDCLFLDQHFCPLKLPPSLPPLSLLCDKSSHTSRHYFFLIFCNKLACFKCRKVTKPDFRRKIRNFFYKQFFEKSGFWPFSRERCISFGCNCIFE